MLGLLMEETYQKFRALIYDASGLNFVPSNRPILEGRLKEQLKKSQLTSYEAYFVLVKQNETELKGLLDAVTTKLTKFFRNRLQYEALQNYVIPQLVQYKNNNFLTKHIKLWSAGCSTGEEAYTNAMCLAEWLPLGWTFEILASDLSLESLFIAQKGWYSATRCNDIPPSLLNRYFTPEDNGYTVKPFLKKHITFDYHNLKYPNDSTNFDIIFCRNVLIYFNEAAQKAVIDKFYQAMTPHSYLFLGHTESLFGFNTSFVFIETNWVPLYGKMTNRRDYAKA